MLALQRGLAAPSITFGHDLRTARLASEHSNLSRSLFDYVSTHPGTLALGPDPLVQQLVSAKGFSKFDAVCLRIAARGKPVTVLYIPNRVWRDQESRGVLLEIKGEAGFLGTKCVLVPQRCLRGNTRAQIARTLALSHYVPVRREHAETVTAYVGAERVTTLSDCGSRLPEHEDPIGVVLALCARGELVIDRSQPIGPKSWVALAN